MIKTTSFAPPRPPRKQRPSSRASGSPSENRASAVRPPQSITPRPDAKILTSARRSAAPDSPTIPVPAKSKSAKETASSELTLAFDFEAPASVVPPVQPAAPPPIAKAKSAPAKSAKKAAATEVEATPVKEKTLTVGAEASEPATTKKRAAKAAAPKQTESAVQSPQVAVPQAKAPQETAPKQTEVAEITEPVAPAAKKVVVPKAKRVRVPVNLAEQYGAKLSKRVESGITDVPTEDAPKKRLNKAEREARKLLLRPDEGLLERLHRAANLIPAKKPVRQKGWKFDCGRCGRTTYFQTPNADICICGAIAVKD